MKTIALRLSYILACALLTGCASTFKPDVSVPKLSGIPIDAGSSAVAIANAQPDTTKIEISQSGTGYTVYGNLHDWTEQAVQSLTRTLEKKRVATSPSAPKSLKIAITRATLSSAASGWSFRCTLVFTIDTGNGQPFELGAEDTSWKWFNACNGAMEKLVTVVLNDERVRTFISGR